MQGRTVQVIEAVHGEPDPRRRIDTLIQVGLTLPHGAEAAIRVWSSVDPQVYAVQAAVDQQRFDIMYESAFEILQNKRQAQMFAAGRCTCSSATNRPPCRATATRWHGSPGSCSTRSTRAGSRPCPT